jgi:hypothetical protein
VIADAAAAIGNFQVLHLEDRTMIDIRAADKVRPYYPKAIKASYLVDAFLYFTKITLGISEERIAFLTSICSDDLNSVELPHTEMVGPFILGGLDGYPFAGKTGLGAFSHHLPDQGAAMMFFGPHVGVSHTGLVGKVVRPGQTTPTACCGAAAHGLQRLEAGEITPKDPSRFAEDDYQQEKLEQLILRHKDDILSAGPPGDARRFIRMSELLYGEMKQAMMHLLASTEFEAPTFVFGGILINEDDGEESSIELRDAGRVDHGKYVDLTKEFIEITGPKFKDIQEGKADAFR